MKVNSIWVGAELYYRGGEIAQKACLVHSCCMLTGWPVGVGLW